MLVLVYSKINLHRTTCKFPTQIFHKTYKLTLRNCQLWQDRW